MAKTTTRPEGNRDVEADGDDRLALILQLVVVQGEQIRSILQVLTAEKPSDGPSLATQLGELILRLDGQTTYLKYLAVAVSKLRRDLPLALVTAIDDNLDIPHRNGAAQHQDGGDQE